MRGVGAGRGGRIAGSPLRVPRCSRHTPTTTMRARVCPMSLFRKTSSNVSEYPPASRDRSQALDGNAEILPCRGARKVRPTAPFVIDEQATPSCDARMEHVRRIRRDRLKRILDQQFPGRGGQAALAHVLDRQTGYISRCLSGEKPIGEVFARYIEQSLHLPTYWLDGERADGPPVEAHHATLLERFDALTPGQKVEFLELLEYVRRRNDEIFRHLQQKVVAAPEGA